MSAARHSLGSTPRRSTGCGARSVDPRRWGARGRSAPCPRSPSLAAGVARSDTAPAPAAPPGWVPKAPGPASARLSSRGSAKASLRDPLERDWDVGPPLELRVSQGDDSEWGSPCRECSHASGTVGGSNEGVLLGGSWNSLRSMSLSVDTSDAELSEDSTRRPTPPVDCGRIWLPCAGSFAVFAKATGPALFVRSCPALPVDACPALVVKAGQAGASEGSPTSPSPATRPPAALLAPAPGPSALVAAQLLSLRRQPRAPPGPLARSSSRKRRVSES